MHRVATIDPASGGVGRLARVAYHTAVCRRPCSAGCSQRIRARRRLAGGGAEGSSRGVPAVWDRAARPLSSCTLSTLTPVTRTPGTSEAEEPHPLRHRGSAVARAGLLTGGWLIVAVLGVAAFLRLVASDSAEPLIVLDALTLVIYLPAWIVAAGALIARRWWLTAAAVVVVAAQVTFAAPELLAASPVPAWAQQAWTVRVFDANVDKSLGFQTGYVKAIERDRPDLITLEEFTPSALQSMTASGVLADFPYQCAAPTYGATGFLIASRLRLTGCRVLSVRWDGEWAPYMVAATWWFPGEPVALRVVHTLAPLPGYWREWTAALAAVDQSVRTSGTSSMLMVGDFNATWDNRQFAALLHDGLTDAAAARGKAIDMTWPNGALVPPFVRIDHLLTGAHLAATAVATGPGFGSDHRYLTATVAIQRAS